MDAKIKIAMRAAREIFDGDTVNLGIGMPTLVADFIDPQIEITLHSENGILGMDRLVVEEKNNDVDKLQSEIGKNVNAEKELTVTDGLIAEENERGSDKPRSKADGNVINAGGQYVSVKRGASFFDSAASFGIARGGHIDKAILGALQVDAEGNLASHIVPGKIVPGMGGAMDLAAGAKRVIVLTTHTAKGEPKILPRVTLPLTAKRCVGLIITELAVIEVTPEGLLLKEIAAETTLSEVIRLTAAPLTVSPALKAF